MAYEDIMVAMQNVQPATVEALTFVNGIKCDIFSRKEITPYDNARGVLATNHKKYEYTPKYKNEQLLIKGLTQQTFDSLHSRQFDAMMREDIYIITHKTQLNFQLYDKVELIYGGKQRVMEIFKMESINGIDGPIIKIAWLSPLT